MTTARPLIEPVAFANGRHPGLGLEIFSIAELRRRVPLQHRRIRTRPEFHQLIWVESGSTEHTIDFVHYRCGAGDALHVRPGQIQQFTRDTRADGWVVLFLPAFVPPDPLLDPLLCPSGVPLLPVAAAERGRVRSMMRALVAAFEAADGRAPSARVLQHLLLALILQLADARDQARERASPQPPAMLRVYRRFMLLLEQRYAQLHDVTAYAELTGCSTKTLVRACSALAGTTPKRLIEQRIVLEAKRLLVHTPSSASAIAAELGFSEPTNFVKFFRRNEQMTPSAFREQARHPS